VYQSGIETTDGVDRFVVFAMSRSTRNLRVTATMT
jgi:hypothetical protein